LDKIIKLKVSHIVWGFVVCGGGVWVGGVCGGVGGGGGGDEDCLL